MKLPQSWNEVTVNQYIELRGLVYDPSDSVFEYQLDRLSVFTDEDLEDLPHTEVTKLVKQLYWLNKEPHKVYAKKIGDYYALPFNLVKWGEFIDLENFIKEGINGLTKIAALLLRKKEVDKWGNKVYEPYLYDVKQRANELQNIPITAIYGLVEEWSTRRNYLINDAYSGLFDGGALSEDELKDLPPEEAAQIRKEEAEQQRFAKWSYESVTLALANDDVTKVKEVLDLKLIFVLNMLSAKSVK